jgi:hypothetical protein
METFWYQIITEDCMQIDFSEVYKIIKEELESDASCDDIYWEFANHLQYYLQNELGYYDFYKDDNEVASCLVVDAFYKYLKENFNYDRN